MRINSLHVTQFRNHLATKIVTGDAALCLLVGPNAAGKTSLLEAIHLLATGIGIRSRRDQDFVHFGTDGYRLDLEAHDRADFHLALKYRNNERREAFADREPLARWTDLLGRLRVALMRPEDLILIDGAPEHRRRFLDVMLCQMERPYFDALRRFRRAARQRQSLTESRSRIRASFALQMEKEMPHIFSSRARVVGELANHIARIFDKLGLDSILKLTYRPAIPKSAASTDWERASRLCIEEGEKLESSGALSLYGPIRDDILIELDEIAVRRFGSQGQKRLAALVLRLAEAEVLSQGASRPIILIDDVLGELDETRSKAIINYISGSGSQTWVASTSQKPYIEHWSSVAKFDIKQGQLEREERL